MTPAARSADTTKPERLASLDWFRFVAVALMVQGHTFYEVLVTSVKNAPWYQWHGYVHGFTAPMFYFSSGLAFGITTLRAWKSHLGWTKTLKKRLERYGILLLIGYGMQAGTFSLRGLLVATPAQRAPMLAVNTLQNIGITLLVAELLVIACRTVPRYFVALLTLTILVVGLGPWASRFDGGSLPQIVAAYLTDHTGSIFPIFPWSGYTLSGVLVAISLVGRDGRTLRSRPAAYLLGIGIGLALAGKLLGLTHFEGFGPHNYWKASPFFFMQRLGVIVLCFGFLRLVEENTTRTGKSRVLGYVQTVAQETLVIYVGHLLLLYGTPWTFGGLHGLFFESLTLAPSIVAFLAVLGVMLPFAYAWHQWKTSSPDTFDRTRWTVTAILIVIYLVNPTVP